jgi:hypothetical protein
MRLPPKRGGLGYGNLIGAPPPSGNLANDLAGVTSSGATASVDQDVLVGPGAEIFWSALFTFDDSSNGNRFAHITFRDDDNGDSIGFGATTVGSGAIRVEAETATTGNLVADGEDNAFVDSHTLLLIGHYLSSAAAVGDVVELIGYDTADADTLASSFDPGDPNAEFYFALTGLDADFAKITSVNFTIRGDDNNLIDELRIGTSYGSVIPEPGVGALLLLGFGGLGAFARARRRPHLYQRPGTRRQRTRSQYSA